MEKIELHASNIRKRPAITAKPLVEGRRFLNPLQSNEGMREFVRKSIKGCRSDYDVIHTLHCLLHTMHRSEGSLELNYKTGKEGGLKTAIETFRTREGNCVATTFLFMAMLREAASLRDSSMKAFYTDVTVDEKEKRVRHCCSAVIIKGKDCIGSKDDVPEEQTNIPFQMNEKFRMKALEQVGLPDEKDLNLILVDLCYPYLNPWHKVFKLVKDEEAVRNFNEMKEKIRKKSA